MANDSAVSSKFIAESIIDLVISLKTELNIVRGF